MATMPTDALGYFSDAAAAFHGSYARDANRLERLAVWRAFFDRFLGGVGFAYDLGCGSGILACELGRRGITVVGLDGAPGMLAIVRQTAAQGGLSAVSFVEQVLPVREPRAWHPADAVIASSSLEYLPSLPEALRSIHGMLAPGGVLLFSISNRHALSRIAVRIIHRLTGRPAYLGLLRQFASPHVLRRDLLAAGFTPLHHAYFAGADRLNRVLGRVLPKRFASNMIIIAAQRL